MIDDRFGASDSWWTEHSLHGLDDVYPTHQYTLVYMLRTQRGKQKTGTRHYFLSNRRRGPIQSAILWVAHSVSQEPSDGTKRRDVLQLRRKGSSTMSKTVCLYPVWEHNRATIRETCEIKRGQDVEHNT